MLDLDLDLVPVPGGRSLLGSDRFYPEERPAGLVDVAPFALARTPVTVSQFAAFVAATGWVTVAEREPLPLPGVDPALLVPGSAVFTPPSSPVPLRDVRAWWSFVPDACWSRPEGPGSDVAGRGDHPVVHVVAEDARAFCRWAGLRLPTEAEWEHAARGGLHDADYAWGDEARPGGSVPATVFRGEFPWRSDGPAGTTPVGSHPANGFGLVDLIGNAWELVGTGWTDRRPARPCCAPAGDGTLTVAKGGSFLCADEHCLRYRPAARIPVAADSPSANVGFRCAA